MKLLGISGSLRKASTNTALLHCAAAAFGDAEFTLADLNIPLFNEDVEAVGVPASVQLLTEQVFTADAVIIATTEYNKAPSGVLKNALDWLSRPRPAPLVGKPVAVMSAAAGIAGGQRAVSTLYLNLIPFKVKLVNTTEVNVGASYEAFDEHGQLKSEAARAALAQHMAELRAAI